MGRLSLAEKRVLWTLRTLPPEEAYGLRIADTSGVRSRLYTILGRFRRRGWVESSLEPWITGALQNHPARARFQLTAAGRMAAADIQLEDLADSRLRSWAREYPMTALGLVQLAVMAVLAVTHRYFHDSSWANPVEGVGLALLFVDAVWWWGLILHYVWRKARRREEARHG